MANYVKDEKGARYFMQGGELIVTEDEKATIPEDAKAPTVKDLLAAYNAVCQDLAEAKKRKARGTSPATAAKREAQDKVRNAAKGAILEAAADMGLRAAENENVPNVVKFYDLDDKYTFYARFGLKTVQFLLKEEAVPAGEKYTTMKYSLPASVVLKYEEVTETVKAEDGTETVKAAARVLVLMASPEATEE